jgi:mRNA interferase RelE/StbE
LASKARRRYRIEVKPSAVKALAGIPKPDRLRIGRVIEALADDPRPMGAVKLAGEDELYRVRSGDYRVVYQIQDRVLLVLVVRVGQRRDVYRRL